jgi:CarD family transcriptional regulator
MKATARTAGSGREASRRAAPQRAAAKPAAKATQATVAKKVAAPATPAAAAHGKGAAEPVAKAAQAVKPVVARAVVAKAVVAKAGAAKPAPTKAPPAPPAEPAAAAKPPSRASSAAAPAKQPATTPATSHAPPVVTAPATAPAAPAPATAITPAPPPAERRPIMTDRVPIRPLAKPEIFIEGDHVVYPTHGVGKVERIATEEIAGHKLELIHITFEENRMTLRVPVAKARTAGLRKLATRKLFDEALAVLKGRARIKRTMWSRRAQEYEAKINSGDPLAIAEVVRDLHRNAGQPDQSFSERQIYEAAMDRLAAELAALDKTDKLTAAGKLVDFLKTV